MAKSLYDRAADRCRQNILRRYPAWRQANLTAPDLPEFHAWKAENLAHLKTLRAAIVTGGEPDIDREWPDPEQWQYQVPPAAKAVPDPTAGEAVLGVLEDAKAQVDRVSGLRRQPLVVGGVSYNFRIDFLQQEQQDDETLKQTDTRLYALYERLELMRPVGITDEEDARRRVLFGNFYIYRGPA